MSGVAMPPSGVVQVIDGFLSDSECGHIVQELQFAHWRRSHLLRHDLDGVERDYFSPCRVSWTARQALFPDSLNEAVEDIERRLSRIAPFQRDRLEDWQATAYPIGGRLDHHVDSGFWQDHPAGERTMSFLLYLTTPRAGGATEFRALDSRVAALTGRLVLWRNLFDDGRADHRMVHAGLPVRRGRKITMVTWVRERRFRPRQAEGGCSEEGG